MKIEKFNMLDHLLDPPCPEPDPERLCTSCYVNMEWDGNENTFWCCLCNDTVTWDEIHHNRYNEGTYDD